MFEAIVNECRSLFSEFGWRRSIFGAKKREVRRALRKEGIDKRFHTNYATLIEGGTVVWAAIAQANEQLFVAGSYDLPGNVVFGLDSYFDCRPHHLLRICDKIYALKDTGPKDVVLAKAAAIITDEQNMIANWRLPWRLTDGHVAYLSSTMFHRVCLPDHVLAGRLLPIVVAPDAVEANMILPQSCWAPKLIENWPRLHELTSGVPKLTGRRITDQQLVGDERDAREHPHRVLAADDLVPGASKAIVSLTPACAEFVRELARNQKLRRNWWLMVGGSEGAWKLDITEISQSREYANVESQGIQILFPRDRVDIFRGLVIDYRKTSIGDGFVFHTSR